MAFQSTRDPAQGRLLLLVAVLFISNLCVAIPLAIVPIYVTEQLGLSNVWGGLGVGIAFFATVRQPRLRRQHFGPSWDQGRGVARTGLLCGWDVDFVVAGVLLHAPLVAFLVLLAGRTLLGLGQSLVSVGVIAWGDLPPRPDTLRQGPRLGRRRPLWRIRGGWADRPRV